jgi:hypothetical protein
MVYSCPVIQGALVLDNTRACGKSQGAAGGAVRSRDDASPSLRRHRGDGPPQQIPCFREFLRENLKKCFGKMENPVRA